MSRATAFAEKIKAAFPGVRITGLDRTPAQQRALVARGVTRSTNSQHIDGNGIDLVLPKGVSASAIKAWIGDQGEKPGEFLVESGKGRNQGTGAHLHIGLAPKAGKPASRQSTFDRVTASRPQKSTVASVFEAYRNTGKPGGMSPQDAAAFENAVNSGQILLPRGAALRSTPSAPVIPKWLVEKHNSHEMDDNPEGRAALQKAVESGEASLPKGMQLKAPPPRTAGETFGMGVRNVMEGAGGLVDIAAAPVNAGINAVAGTNLSTSPFRDAMSYGADKMGLATPESSSEKFNSGVIEGGTQGLATAGLGLATSGAKGITGMVAREVAASPVLDTVSGSVAGGSQESARQAGAGPVGQTLAALAGGLSPVGVAKTVERIRTPKTLPDAVAETPREVMMTPDGELTPHGQDVAARHGATPEQVRQAYDAPPTVQRGAANEGDVTQPQARAVGDNAPEAPQAAPQPQEAPIAPEPAPQARVAPEAAPEPVVAPVERVQTANDFGIPLSRGEATKNFDIQAREQALRGDTGPESDAARAFKVKQTEAIKEAVSRYKSALGDEGLTAEERGTAIQDALRDLSYQGKAGVTELYKQARELGAPVKLDAAKIRNTYEGLMAEADIPEQVKNVLTQEAMRYGLIGKPVVIDAASGAVTAESGVTKVKLDNGDVKTFRGPPKELALDTAEEFRQAVSKQYPVDGPQKLTLELSRAIDDAVESAIETAAVGDLKGDVGEAFKAARAAHKVQKQTFAAKDVIQDLIDWKKGAEGVTSKLSPEQVVTRAFRSTSDLRKVKAILLGKGNPKGKEAWNALQAHGVATIFDKATIRNQNVAGEVTDAISGAKLRSAIEAFGPDKLKVLLDADQFGQLMKMRRTIEDATIPISGTTNPSGSGLLVMRLFKGLISGIPYASTALDVATAGVSKVKAAAQKAETVKGLDYTPEKAATETALPGQENKPGVMARAGEASGNFIKAFIDTFKTPESLTPVLVAATDTEQR